MSMKLGICYLFYTINKIFTLIYKIAVKYTLVAPILCFDYEVKCGCFMKVNQARQKGFITQSENSNTEEKMMI